MQKQQYGTQTVLLEKRISGEDTTAVMVERYKVKEEKTFRDGFKLVPEYIVRKVIGSSEENGFVNVVFEDDDKVKRMFWIEKSELELQSYEEEVWSRADLEKESKDRLESWFE